MWRGSEGGLGTGKVLRGGLGTESVGLSEWAEGGGPRILKREGEWGKVFGGTSKRRVWGT